MHFRANISKTWESKTGFNLLRQFWHPMYNLFRVYSKVADKFADKFDFCFLRATVPPKQEQFVPFSWHSQKQTQNYEETGASLPKILARIFDL